MQVTNHCKRWAARTALAVGVALCSVGVAQAAGGRIAFSGAIVAPTCGLNAQSVDRASQDGAHAVQVTCQTPHGQDPARAYQLKLTRLSSDTVDPRVNTYFAGYAASPHTMVAVQTYR